MVTIRKDASRNRALLLEAAREVFAESASATLDDIAERAGVGTGTLPALPQQTEIAAEVLAGATQQIVTDAEDVGDQGPWQAIVMFETTAERRRGSRALPNVGGQGVTTRSASGRRS
jgi:AcrR family transcriptional regulator